MPTHGADEHGSCNTVKECFKSSSVAGMVKLSTWYDVLCYVRSDVKVFRVSLRPVQVTSS